MPLCFIPCLIPFALIFMLSWFGGPRFYRRWGPRYYGPRFGPGYGPRWRGGGYWRRGRW